MTLGGGQPIIVAGVSGSRASYAALTWAAAEARRRGARLRVVQAWTAHPPRAPYAVAAAPAQRIVPANAAAAGLSRLAHLALSDPAEGGAEIELIEGPAERVLVDASSNADLLVLGAGRHPPVGPAIRACLQHARCPVVVVGPDLARSGRPEPRPEAQPGMSRRASQASLAKAHAGS